MRKITIILLLCIFSACSGTAISFAQEVADEEVSTEPDIYFASGLVVEVSNAQIIILEYDFDAGEEIKTAYQINSQTEFEGVSGAEGLKVDDDVEIEYQLIGEQNIATRIEKYESDFMEDDV